MKFGQLILRKIIKIVSTTRCQILRLKCITFDFGWSAPDPAGFKLDLRGLRGEREEKGRRAEGREGGEALGPLVTQTQLRRCVTFTVFTLLIQFFRSCQRSDKSIGLSSSCIASAATSLRVVSHFIYLL